MRTGEVYIDAVTVPSGRRPLNPDTVDRLVESIGKIGLQQPISVWSPDSETVVLVAGNHRLEACRRLGEHKIPAVFIEMDERQRRMWEIAENLHRAELTALERDEQVAEWIRLSAEKVSQDGTPKGGQQPAAKGVRAAEREIGVRKNDASRALQVASLTPEAKEAARETGQDDNRTALLDAAKQAPERQAQFLRDRSATREQNAREDRDLAEEAAEKVAELLAEHIPGHLWDGLKANLNAAGSRNIAKALNRLIGVSVFDNTAAGAEDIPEFLRRDASNRAPYMDREAAGC